MARCTAPWRMVWLQPAHRSSASALPSPRCRHRTADTTLGLLLTIALHTAALQAAAWYGRRAGTQPSGGVPQAAEEAGSATDGGALGSRWFEVLQACGNYGAQLFACGAAAALPLQVFVARRCPVSVTAPCCLPPAPATPPTTLHPAGDPPSYRRWGIQLAEWVACVVAARAICGTVVVLLGSALVHVAQVRAVLRLEAGWAGVVGSAAAALCYVQRLARQVVLWLHGPLQAAARLPEAGNASETELLPARARCAPALRCRAWTACLRATPRCCSTQS